jgi:hypothetical protein
MTVRQILWNKYPEITKTESNQEVEAKKKILCLYGHFYFGAESKWLVPEFGYGVGRTYITMLRQPFDRVLSAFAYAKRFRGYWRKRTLKDFIVRKGGSNRMTQCLSGGDPNDIDRAMNNLEMFDHVGLVEKFDDSMRLFGLPTKTAMNVSSNRLEIKDLTAEELRLLTLHNRNDLRLYEEATYLFYEELKNEH